MKRLVVDLDGTLTIDDETLPYSERLPNLRLISKLQAYKADGFEIIIHSARNMRTFHNSVGKINAFTVPTIIAWLQRHGVPFDEVHVGKPWCGLDGFYVDDKAIRPSEFLGLSAQEIRGLISP